MLAKEFLKRAFAMGSPVDIGIVLGPGGAGIAVHARGKDIWHHTIEYDGRTLGAVDAGAVMAELLTHAKSVCSLPRPRSWRSMSAAVALGAPFGTVKELDGLPAPAPPRILESIVRTNPQRFFLTGSSDPKNISLHVLSEGAVIGACFDASIVQLVVETCERWGVRLRYVIPMIAPKESQSRAKLPLVSTASTDDATTHDNRTEDEGTIAADVAVNAHLNPLKLRLNAHTFTLASLLSTRRLRTARAFAGGLIIISALLPGIEASMIVASTQRELSRTSTESERVSESQARLMEVTGDLKAYGAVPLRAHSVLDVLSSIAELLPDGVAVLSLTIKEDEVMMTVVGDNVTAAAATLEGSSIVMRAEVIGSVMRTAVSSQDLDGSTDETITVRERASVRLLLGSTKVGV